MSHPPLKTWFDTLRAIYPPQGALLVGAGPGSGFLAQWLCENPCDYTCLVEADAQIFQHLERNLASISGVKLVHKTVTQEPGPKRFHHLSNAAENGLLSASNLLLLWPNIRSTENGSEPDVSAGATLASLLTGVVNWLFIDCLPGANLLQGAGQSLSQLDVVLVRVVLNEEFPVTGALHSSVERHLQQSGFQHIHTEEERNPDLALCLYARDSRVAQAQKQHRIDQLETEINNLRRRTDLQAEQLQSAEAQISLIKNLFEEPLP